MNVSSVKNLNGEALSSVQDASLTNVIQTNSGNWQDITAYQNASATYLTEVSIPESAVWQDVSTTVQINSAQWADVGAITSYTTTLSDHYGGVINTLNETFISAFLSQSADNSNFANNANSAKSAKYAETVNETYLENKGFARNLTSEYGTVSIVNNNIIESTNSAIVRTISNEGFVSSYSGQSLGPVGNGIATYRWDKSLPNTIISLHFPSSKNEILTYSANTNLTGEIALPAGENTQTINIPNATEFKVWTNNWVYVYTIVVSAADQFETVVGELALTSALPTYEYDGTNKISAINGSALAGGNTEVSHDNTLSGNGTVNSPLGVVPGYNETVLFNTTNTSTINTLNYQLSESIYNFEKIGVFIKRTPVPMQIFDTNDISASNGLFNTNYISMSDAFSTNEMYFFTTPWSIGSNGTVISATNKSFGVTFDLINVKFNCYKNNGTGPLYKIVGINRKAQ